MTPAPLIETAASEAAPHAIELGYRGLRLRVRATAAPPLWWLREFTLPWLDDAADCRSAVDITLVIDATRYQRLIDSTAGDPAPREIDCFTLDGEFERHALWLDDGRSRTIHHARGQCVITIAPPERRVTILARADDARLRMALLRIVRELATLASLSRGDLFFHAAAAEYAGGALLFAGAKRSGKTSMLINALRHAGVRCLSNDRVMVSHAELVPAARGMPTIVKVRPQSLEHLSGLAPPQWDRPHRHYLSLRECAQGSELLEPATRVPTSMSALQFGRWLGVEMVPQAPLIAAVFPVIDPDAHAFDVQPLDPQAAAMRLQAALFWRSPNGPTPQAFSGIGPIPTAAPDGVACAALAERLMCLECRIGPAAFSSPNVWTGIVARLS